MTPRKRNNACEASNPELNHKVSTDVDIGKKIEDSSSSTLQFYPVDNLHAHPGRKREILASHPELKKLSGYEWKTKYLAVLLVVAGLTITALVGKYWNDIPLWAFAILVYVVGTPLNHASAMVIHECSHGLSAGSMLENRMIAIFVNFPMGVPAAMSFCRYHPVHHSHMGVIGQDLDLPPYAELNIVGNDSIKKLIWHSLYMFSYGLRPVGWGTKQVCTGWEALNIAIQLTVDAVMVYMFGYGALLYMFLGTFFAFGLHPCGAHFIQEHYKLHDGPHNSEGHVQETFSYYGWLNPFILNVGYHNEHHDLSTVPWTRLPTIKKTAPEYYDSLHSHTSILDIFRVFHSRKDIGPYSRVCRSYDSYKIGVKNFVSSLKPGQSTKMG
jgi:sphingolipid delta-4 desaturase